MCDVEIFIDTNLWSSTTNLANIAVMKLRLFRRWLRLHHLLFLLTGSDLVFPPLPLWCLLMMLLLNEGRGGVIDSCLVSLRLVICSIPSWGTTITWSVVRTCLAVSGCLCTSVRIRISHSGRLRWVSLGRMSFRNNRSSAHWCRINICSRRWVSCFGCPSSVLSVISILSALYVRGRLLRIIRRLGFVGLAIVVLSWTVMCLVSAVSCLIRGICRWRWWRSVLLSCRIAISTSLRGRSLLSISSCASWVRRLYDLSRCLILWGNIVPSSRSRSLNSVTSSSLGCSITGLNRWILSLSKTLRVLSSRRIAVVIAGGHVGWLKEKEARGQDVKPAKRKRRGLDSNYLENEANKCRGSYEIKFLVRRRLLEGGAYRKIGRDKDKFSFDLTAVSLSAHEISW